MLNIVESTEDARYSSALQEVVNNLGGVEILRCSFGPEEVDIDVLLEDGGVFCYEYDITDCTWWDKIELRFVKAEMLEDSICYASLEIYEKRKEFERRQALASWEPLSYA